MSFDMVSLEKKCTPRTKGLIWVHLTGLMASNYRAILDFAKKRGLFVIEDCAHAHGARVDGREAGSLGDVGCFSFFPTKLMTSGVGGMITTNDARLDRFAREMRFFGRNLDAGEVVREGNDWVMDEFRACVAVAQFGEFDAMLARRRAIAGLYQRALANQPGLRLPFVPDNVEHAYYQFPVFLNDRAAAVRAGKALAEKHGIQAKRIYLPVHEEKMFAQYDDGSFRGAEDMLHRSLCLPMHAALSDDDIERASAALVAEVRAAL
jgi:dTDP-4-amino-4,6-dideoxygalactose transaminase